MFWGGRKHCCGWGFASPPPVQAIADEDLPRSDQRKTSAVHFLRFELEPAMAVSLRRGALLAMGCDHPAYRLRTGALPAAIGAALAGDLETSIQATPPCKLPEPY